MTAQASTQANPLTPVVLALLLALLLGCQRSADPEGGTVAPGDAASAAAAAEDTDAAALDDQPDEDVPPATAPAPLPPPSRDPGPARMDGYAALRLGMDASEMHAAWEGASPLAAAGPAIEGDACHYLWPKGEAPDTRPAFMLENGHFVRYDVSDPGIEAPGGGRVDMQADAIRALYDGRYQAMPHKYVEGAQYLRVTAAEAGAGVLLFEIDAEGRVSRWRVGQAPQVDYVEGCS